MFTAAGSKIKNLAQNSFGRLESNMSMCERYVIISEYVLIARWAVAEQPFEVFNGIA